jgi:hypothetical protein
MQNPDAVFNFSLNFPICNLQEKLDELKYQMQLGLHLTSYEVGGFKVLGIYTFNGWNKLWFLNHLWFYREVD